MRKNARLCSLLAVASLCFAGCGAATSMDTAHYQVTFLNGKRVQPANRTEQADFLFKIKGLGQATAPETIRVRFDNLDMDHGKNEVEVKRNAQGVYEAKTKLPMGGHWQAVVKVGDDNAPFRFEAEGDAMAGEAQK